MTVDIRSEDPTVLADLEARALAFLEDQVHSDIAVDVEELGRRPAGKLAVDDPLLEAATVGLREVGRSAQRVAASTDANAAYAAGVSAIAIGITTGASEHTVEEWVDVAPVADGLRALVRTLVVYDGANR